MCQGLMHDFLVALPKCEHHIHIEGSLEPELFFELAARNKVLLPKDEDPAFNSVASLKERYSRFSNLDDFLHYYFIAMSCLVHRDDFEALAYAYFKKAASQNVQHAEIFFDPQQHMDRGVAYNDIVLGLSAARRRAFTDFGLTSELIVCILRHFPVESCHQAVLTALPDLQDGTVRGLGLSSTELGNPPHLYRNCYNLAIDQGVRFLTAHAGEEADVSYMASAVHDLDCVRVDHGIKLADDPALMKEFAEKQILITMCPISNLDLKCVKSIADLPVRTYLAADVPFSINSDDPAYFGGGAYIQENYCAVQTAFNLSHQDWLKIATSSITLSWCLQDRKNELLNDLRKVKRDFQVSD